MLELVLNGASWVALTQKAEGASAELQTCFIEKATRARLKKGNKRKITLPTSHQKKRKKTGVCMGGEKGGFTSVVTTRDNDGEVSVA